MVLVPLDVVAMAGLVFAGSVVPVVPTGAVVTAAAALAMGGQMSTLIWVVVLGAGAAFAGDVVTFAVSRLGSGRLHRWSGAQGATAGRVSRLQERGGLLIVVSRLIPAGRMPTIAAAGVLKFPWPRFLLADGVGVALWVMAYAGLGVAGGGAFARPWVGALAALAAVLAIEGVLHGMRRLRGAHASQRDADLGVPAGRAAR